MITGKEPAMGFTGPSSGGYMTFTGMDIFTVIAKDVLCALLRNSDKNKGWGFEDYAHSAAMHAHNLIAEINEIQYKHDSTHHT